MSQCSWTGELALLIPRTGDGDGSVSKQQLRPMWLKASSMARLKLLLPPYHSNREVPDASCTYAPILELWLQQQMLHRADLSCPQQCRGGLMLCSTPATSGPANSIAASSSSMWITRPDNQVVFCFKFWDAADAQCFARSLQVAARQQAEQQLQSAEKGPGDPTCSSAAHMSDEALIAAIQSYMVTPDFQGLVAKVEQLWEVAEQRLEQQVADMQASGS